MRGKTGTGYQMRDDGTPDLTRQVGWFVGWAAKGKRTIVFVYAVGDEQASPTRAGLRARESFMQQLPALLDALPAAARSRAAGPAPAEPDNAAGSAAVPAAAMRLRRGDNISRRCTGARNLSRGRALKFLGS